MPWVIAAAAALFLVVAGYFAWRMARSPRPLRVSFFGLLNESYCRIWFGVPARPAKELPPGGVIIVCNHTSGIDPMLLLCQTRRTVSFLVAKEYFANPAVRFWLNLIDCIPVDREAGDASAARAAVRYLRGGKVVGIFPEGRITTDGHLQEPHLGVALIALRSGAPVIPARISGMRTNQGIVAAFLMPCRAKLRWGPEVDLSGFRGQHHSRELLQRAAETIMASIAALEGKA
jgi:1-acyl-sn-glycerol-3-phosphate acyltransferase